MILENRELFFIGFFAGTLIVSFFVTKLVLRWVKQLNLYDAPTLPRKIQKEPKPYSGGIAVYLSFVIGLIVLALVGGTDEISGIRIAALILSGLILIIGGVLDDKYQLSPIKQFAFPVVATIIIILSGTHISFINSPLGGSIVLDQYKFLTFPVFGSLLVFVWIMVMTYTKKFLDGMDGLVPGISTIAGIIIFGLSLLPEVNQTTTAFLALIFAASTLGFLFFNFYPAKIFLGEGGSTLTGFMIGVLAVISGAKIATALLVLGIAVFDLIWVIVRRIWFGESPFVGDKKHLHFRLLDIGLSQRQTVLLMYLLTASFGGVAVFLQSTGKLIALIILGVFMTVLAIALAFNYNKDKIEP